MLSEKKHAANAVDFAASVVLAAAVAFAASALGNGVLASLAAPITFMLAYVGLRRVDSDRQYRLAEFELQTIDPRYQDEGVVRPIDDPAAGRGNVGDAAESLSNALAELKRSMR